MHNLNQLHGTSVLIRVPYDKEQVMKLFPAAASDKNFEVVYAAQETFEDGYVRDLVCYRRTNPDYTPKAQGVAQVLTERITL